MGSELETCGYGCLDHFHEPDTFSHSWEVLEKILRHIQSDHVKQFAKMLILVGVPVMHKSTAYNCVVAIYNL